MRLPPHARRTVATHQDVRRVRFQVGSPDSCDEGPRTGRGRLFNQADLKAYVGALNSGSAVRRTTIPAENQHGFDFSNT